MFMCSCVSVHLSGSVRGSVHCLGCFFKPAIGNPWQCDSVIKVKNHSARNSPGQQQVHWGEEGEEGRVCVNVCEVILAEASGSVRLRIAHSECESSLCRAAADHCGHLLSS